MTPADIIKARKKAGLTQTQAAQLLGVSLRAWQYWEKGGRVMPRYAFDHFLLLAAKKP